MGFKLGILISGNGSNMLNIINASKKSIIQSKVVTVVSNNPMALGIQKAKENKTYEQFCDSPYYNAFVKFGSFVNNVRPLYPEKYVDYVVTSGVKLDHWCREEMYQKYAIDLILREKVEAAMERSIKTMMDWGDEKDAPWSDYFKYASLNRAVMDIKDGKISPWLILNCKSGKEMMGRLNDEQLQIVYNIMDPNHWSLRFKRLPADVEMVKEVTKEARL